MKKIFSLFALLLMAASMMAISGTEWAEISFSEEMEASTTNDNLVFTAGDSEFTVTLCDPEGEMAIDKSKALFGTASVSQNYEYRLKTGGKSTSTKNYLTLNIPKEGKLRLAVRTGKNEDTNRTLSIKQNDEELYGRAVAETDIIESGVTKYYQYICLDVKAGTVSLTYPVNGLNFYSFAWKPIAASQPLTKGYYLVGNINDWNIQSEYMFTSTKEEGIYKLENVVLNEGDEIKVKSNTSDPDSWYPGYGIVGYKVEAVHEGLQTIYFNPAGNMEWETFYAGGYIMIEPSAPVLIPNDTIVIEANQGIFWDDATVEMGYWQAALDDGIHVLSISNIESDQADGIYTINDLDPDYTYYVDYTTFDTISFIDGEVIITQYAEDSVLIEGQLIGDDYKLYVINLLYWEPKPLNDVMLQNNGAMIDDGLVSEGLLGIYATDEKTYSLILALFTDNIEGDWTEEDIYGPYSMISDGYNGWLIYSLELSVKQNEDGSYTATGWILCYNNTMYHLDFQIPASSEGIENVLTGEKAAKFIQNGQLIIRKNGVHYNAAGQKLR